MSTASQSVDELIHFMQSLNDNESSSINVPIAIDKQPHRTFRAWKMNKKHTLMGYSRSADKTFFYIPQLRICLDGGYCRGRLGNHLFLTHGHFDHCMDIGYMATHKSGMTLHCPFEITQFVKNYIASFTEINCNQTLSKEHKCDFTIDGLRPGDYRYFGTKIDGKDVIAKGFQQQSAKKKKKSKNDEYRMEAFECDHAVPCLGFMFDEKRRKKKKEFADLDWKKDKMKILELRKNGIEFMESIYLPLFVYVGDTSINVFESNPKILRYPVIIIECTFLYDADIKMDKLMKDGHIKWSQLKEYVVKYREITFVLIHFSCRYKEDQIIQFFENENKQMQIESNGKCDLNNCVIWACSQSDGTQKVCL